ncbi:unnamed protein product [Durusdinium trenchii]|uniref:RING-type domain-containing protein n=1 Tax=Durusdinium trenchii TaxID=1381693 RepID=A0ABP0QLF3_9DINO
MDSRARFGNKTLRQDSPAAANCPICCGPLRHCVALVPCGHAFCKTCVQVWLQQSPSCPTCRGCVEDGQWVRVRVMDEVLMLLQSKTQGAEHEKHVEEEIPQASTSGESCWTCRRNDATEVCGVCEQDLGLCQNCAVHSMMQCEECEAWMCGSWCASKPCVYCRTPHVCANCYQSPLRRCPRPEC